MKRLLILCCFLLVPWGKLSAQLPENLLEQAAQWERQLDWASAVACYEAYLAVRTGAETEVRWRYAHCLRRLYDYRLAEQMYKQVWAQDSLHYPDALFYWAQVCKNRADYVQAERLFRTYLSYCGSVRDTAFLVRWARQEVKACAAAERMLEEPQPCEVRAFPSAINSPYSEFNARLMGDSVLYFSCLRPITQDGGDKAVMEGYYAARLYKARLRKQSVASVSPLRLSAADNRYHNANVCFNPSHTRLFLTRSKVTESLEANASIWVSDFRDGRWQKPYPLPEPVNLPQTTNTQPFVTEVNGTEVLYFVSNRSGGYGGTDIWYAVAEEDGAFRAVANVGPVVNTPGNEVTPFYQESNKTLYFSSDWHPGMGGFDIFKVKGGLSQWQASPQNMGYPLNSPANDIYFVCDSSEGGGCFASNRGSAKALSDALCCNDLYRFERRPVRTVVHTDTLWGAPSSASLPTKASRKASSLLPLTLYFHNDEPDPRTTADTTDWDYQATLSMYLALQPQYEQAFSEGLPEEAAREARQQMRRFFEDSLSQGNRRLNLFFAFLKEDLESGSRVALKVEGHASPLHTDAYNWHLSSRRIHSLWNSLREYDKGFFQPYLQSGALRFQCDPKGDRQSRPYVSANPNDKRHSVYSIAAALERRIQITGYVSEPAAVPSADSLFGLPATAFVLKEKPGADRYVYSIYLKNTASEPVRVEVRSSDAEVSARVGKETLQAGEEAFLEVRFGASLFERQPEVRLELLLHAGSGLRRVPVSLRFFKQK
ncbi:MAG: PD40 domain-containing protein [Bacteroidales bacterium]|nr:PD40 domain-containing protein [Bacteroidales bacterium]